MWNTTEYGGVSSTLPTKYRKERKESAYLQDRHPPIRLRLLLYLHDEH